MKTVWRLTKVQDSVGTLTLIVVDGTELVSTIKTTHIQFPKLYMNTVLGRREWSGNTNPADIKKEVIKNCYTLDEMTHSSKDKYYKKTV